MSNNLFLITVSLCFLLNACQPAADKKNGNEVAVNTPAPKPSNNLPADSAPDTTKTKNEEEPGRNDQAAIIKDITMENGSVYLTADYVEIKMTGVGNEFKIVNNNSKLRKLKLNPTAKVDNCIDPEKGIKITPGNIMEHKKEIMQFLSKGEFVIMNVQNDAITQLNIGCYN